MLQFSYNFDSTGWAWAYARVEPKPGCKFRIDLETCKRIMSQIAWQCPLFGGHMEDNCSYWMLDPGTRLLEGYAPGGRGIQNPPH